MKTPATANALTDWVWSRWHGALPGSKGNGLLRLLVYIALTTLMTLTTIILRPQMTMNMAAAAACALSLSILGFLLFFHENMLRMDPGLHWWLQLPHPRTALVKATFRAYCRLGLVLHTVIGAGFLIACLLLSLVGHPLPAAPESGSTLPLLLLSAVIGIPITAGYSQFSTVFFVRRWVVGILSLFYIIIGFGVGPMLLGILVAMGGAPSSPVEGWLSPLHLTYILLIQTAVGLPLLAGMLHLTAAVGMRNVADPRNLSAAGSLASGKPSPEGGLTSAKQLPQQHPDSEFSNTSKTSKANQPRTPFRQLCRLESRRISGFTRHRVVRIISLISVIALFIGGIFANGYAEVTLLLPLVLSGVCGYILVLVPSSLLSLDIHRRVVPWWLMFPVSRLSLLLARVVVYTKLASWWTVCIFGSFWLGVLSRSMFDPSRSIHALGDAAIWTFYSLLLGMAVYLALLCLFLGSSIVGHTYPAASFVTSFGILIPIYMQGHILSFYYPIASKVSAVSPYWDHLLITTGVCVLLILLALWGGVRYLNPIIHTRPRKQWRSITGRF